MIEGKNEFDNNDLYVIAIIPARGGSKGIPKKNIVNLAGKPLISYIIEAAKSSNFISKIYVSTDDNEISSIVKNLDVDVIMRPSELSMDDSSSESALLHVIDQLRKNNDKIPDLIVFLQCTSPLTLSSDIDNTIKKLLLENADTSFTVTPSHYFLWTEKSNGDAVAINHIKNERKRRQDCNPQYTETGSVYVMRYEGFLKYKHRFFGKTVLSVIPPERALDIDEPSDIPLAEYYIKKNKRSIIYKHLPKRLDGVVFDFDGVFTNNKVIVHEDGKESVICDRSDGMALSQLKSLNIPILVLSKEKNPVVQIRCNKLDIPYKQDISDKIMELKEWLDENKLDSANIIFLGNDINDLSCIEYVGCGVAVGDAYPEVKSKSKITLSSSGGNGAIRELCDLIRRK